MRTWLRRLLIVPPVAIGAAVLFWQLQSRTEPVQGEPEELSRAVRVIEARPVDFLPCARLGPPRHGAGPQCRARSALPHLPAWWSTIPSCSDPATDVVAAARQASRDRFRPVLLTSLTTIAGPTPLLFEQSLQAQVLVPLVTSLAFGLLASTALVLLMVPALYAVLHDFGLTTVAREQQTAASSSPEGAAGDGRCDVRPPCARAGAD